MVVYKHELPLIPHELPLNYYEKLYGQFLRPSGGKRQSRVHGHYMLHEKNE